MLPVGSCSSGWAAPLPQMVVVAPTCRPSKASPPRARRRDERRPCPWDNCCGPCRRCFPAPRPRPRRSPGPSQTTAMPRGKVAAPSFSGQAHGGGPALPSALLGALCAPSLPSPLPPSPSPSPVPPPPHSWITTAPIPASHRHARPHSLHQRASYAHGAPQPTAHKALPDPAPGRGRPRATRCEPRHGLEHPPRSTVPVFSHCVGPRIIERK